IPTISAAFWRVTPLCSSQSTSILSRIRSLGCEVRSSLTTRRCSSVNCTRSQAMVRILAWGLDLSEHPYEKRPKSIRLRGEWECLSQGRAGYIIENIASSLEEFFEV